MGIEKRSAQLRKKNRRTRNPSSKQNTLTALAAAFEKAGWRNPTASAESPTYDKSDEKIISATKTPAPFRTKPTGRAALNQCQELDRANKMRPNSALSVKESAQSAKPVRRKRTKAELAAEAKILGSSISRPATSPSSSVRHKDSYEDKKLRINDLVFNKLQALEKEDSHAACGLDADISERATIAHRIEAGRRHNEPNNEGSEALYVSLGVDFGTTSTKIVARQLYTDGEPAMAAPVPPFAQADGNPHLWITRLWLSDHGHLTLTPEPNAELVPSLKTSLLKDPSPTNEAQAAAFLALMIAHTRGWISEREEITRRGNINWSYNFGFPAASLDKESLKKCYQRVITSALLLADCAGFIDLKTALATIESVGSKSHLDKFEAALQPEVAAAAAAIKGPNRIPNGLFVMIDVGGSTVDCCAFRLRDDDGLTKMPIMQAAVELYGVLPSRICAEDKRSKSDFHDLLRRQLRSIIFKLRQENSRLSQTWIDGLPIFFVGGGTKSAPHIQEVERLSPWLLDWLLGEASGAYIYNDLSLGDLIYNSSEPELHRLTVATGLSYAEDQIPQVQLPDLISPSPPPLKRRWEDSYVGPEQT